MTDDSEERTIAVLFGRSRSRRSEAVIIPECDEIDFLVETAIHQARSVAGGKDIKLGGASPGQQALQAGLCDEILIHLAPYLLGGGVRLLDRFEGPVRLEKISATDGTLATHLRYRVLKK